MRKSERLGFVLSPREKSALEDLAEIEGGLSQSAVLRRLIRAEAQRRGVWPGEQFVVQETHRPQGEEALLGPGAGAVRSAS